MKKSVLFVALLLGLSLSSYAQRFVGGSVGLSHSAGTREAENTSTELPNETSFSLAPIGGMFLSERLAVGLQLTYHHGAERTPGEVLTVSRNSIFGFVPFVRYYALSLNKFHLFAQGNLGFTTSRDVLEVGATTTRGPRANTFLISVRPALAFDLSEKVSLEASITGLNFGYSLTSVKDGAITDRRSNFNMGANLGHILDIDNINIGAIIKF